MKTKTLLLFATALLVPAFALRAADPDPQTVFQNPPEAAKPGVWWHWMGCNVTKEGITRDLEEFKRVGIGGASIFGMADVCTPWAAHIENSPNDGLIAFTDPWWENSMWTISFRKMRSAGQSRSWRRKSMQSAYRWPAVSCAYLHRMRRVTGCN